jgi:hypothetical protein
MGIYEKKGQGSTEYIVMLAVALIVVLVTAALLGFFPSFSGDAQVSEYETYWTSARPIAIMSGIQSSAAGKVVTLVVENHAPKDITVSLVQLTNPSNSSVINYAPAATISGGSKTTWTFPTSINATDCTSRSGKANTYWVNVSYRDLDYTRAQVGSKPVAVICQ